MNKAIISYNTDNEGIWKYILRFKRKIVTVTTKLRRSTYTIIATLVTTIPTLMMVSVMINEVIQH